ncbi:cell division protein FtsA [Pseudomonadota bacterium]
MAKGQIIAGIDVGTDKVCTIIASVSPETENVNVIGVASHSSKGVRKSQIVDIEDAIGSITESVEAAERMAGYSVKNAYVSISGNHISSQNSKGVVAVAEPEGEIIPEDVSRVIEAARAVSLPASREVLHVIPRDFVVDSQEGIKDPIGMTGVRLEAEAHIITAASTATRNLVKCISEVGIDVNELIFSGLAGAYSTISETERELGVVLIDIGAGTTSMSVYVEGSLAHSSVLPVGARNITNDLAIGMRISLNSAELIKRHLSKSSSSPTKPAEKESSKERIARKRKADEIDLTRLHLKEDIKTASRKTIADGIIRPRLNEIFQMIGKDLKSTGLSASTPAGIVLTGGGAETIGIVDAAKRVLSMPTRTGIPKGLSGLVDEIQYPAFATSMGLIMYGLQVEPERATRATFTGITDKIGKIPAKGMVKKLTDIAKSFLP